MQPSGRKRWQGKRNTRWNHRAKVKQLPHFPPGLGGFGGRNSWFCHKRVVCWFRIWERWQNRFGHNGKKRDTDPSRERKAGGGDRDENCRKRVPTAISSNCEISHCAARFYTRKTAKDHTRRPLTQTLGISGMRRISVIHSLYMQWEYYIISFLYLFFSFVVAIFCCCRKTRG